MFSGHQRGKPSYRTQPEIKHFKFVINRFLRVLTYTLNCCCLSVQMGRLVKQNINHITEKVVQYNQYLEHFSKQK